MVPVSEETQIIGRNEAMAPPSLPPAGKISREMGLISILLAVLASATYTFVAGKTSDTVYSLVLIGELFIVAQLLSGRSVDISALSGIILRR